MSLINKMLQDLDARGSQGSDPAQPHIKSVVRAERRVGAPVIAAAAGGAVLIAVAGFFGWRYFKAKPVVPVPMAAAQLGLAWLAARDARPRVSFVAAVLLSAVCLMSVLFGLFDGDLIGNVASDGFVSWGFAWGVVLLCVTAVVGVLAFVRARQLRRLR